MSSTQPTTNSTHPLSPIIKGDTDTTTVQSVTSGTVAGLTKLTENVSRITTTVAPSSVLYNKTQKSINELLYNGTGYYIEDEEEPGLNDLHTLLLACFATLVFLAVTVSTVFGIRLMWKKYRRSKENSQYDGILHREGTSESISRPLHSHLLEDKLIGTDTNLSMNTEELDVTNNMESQVRSNNHSNTNGSIITMTMKNNHLIVETEERNDLEEDSRETTMTYSPSARNGVFVVEVQQGVRRSPGSGGPTSCIDPASVSVSDQCALVHNPPDKYSDEETLEEYDDSEYYIETVSPNTETPDSLSSKAKTGLAQSNTSLNYPSYCYTNQTCYDINSYGCSQYAGYKICNEQTACKDVDDTRPKITAAVYKSGLKRSPSTEDLHLASINGVVDDGGNTKKDYSLEDQIRSVYDKRTTSTATTSSRDLGKAKIVGDVASNTNVKETETGSTDYENEGFECNDLAKS
ncbi:unnamed protein product [Psylliodes chrysocephalus]|uniref:Uncharacterized protein n=1 Tax=Psylliodes chrysocephalus TaxID=3402493 RepID=A0A9P0CEW6_9CUCU|nr:unnamed protein product [Psylliodes chrysocephala]